MLRTTVQAQYSHHALRESRPTRNHTADRIRPVDSYTGNQAILRRLSPTAPRLQFKLKVGATNDPLEAEADRAADEVMRVPGLTAGAASAPSLSSAGPTLQRLCEECEKQKNEGDADVDDAAAGLEIEGDVASEIYGMRGGGAPLPGSHRAFFEPRFGHDLTNVRVHNDSQAARLSRSVNARAFTLGNHVVFGAGEYSPGSRDGDRVLAHELAHVVQQGQSQPFIQRLSITQTTFSSGNCGNRNVQWAFSLDAPAAQPGYIVQHINTYEFVKTCPDKAIGPPGPTQEFWEAWPIAAGKKVHWRTEALGRTDLSIRQDRPNENGSQESVGQIKFFDRNVTGDLGDFNAAPTAPGSNWGPGKVSTSGKVPSTPTKPSWWDSTPVEGPANRLALSQWDCCDSDPAKRSSTVTADP